MSWYGEWRPYVPVARRRAQAAAYAKNLAKKENRTLAPVNLEGRNIARSFWGQAWCENLEQYSDFANRLPRGRTYVRNGSVIDLQVERGKVKALVSGSEIYRVTIAIETLPKVSWRRIRHDCSQSIDSLIDLLQGRFDQGIMRRLTERDQGLFPKPKEIQMKCTCPDWAWMCKHVAATLYGVGARLDTAPELLFTLRDVDHLELISQAVAAENLDRTLAAGRDAALAGSDLGELFGIDIDVGGSTSKKTARRKRSVAAPSPDSAAPPAGAKSASKGRGKSVMKSSKAPRKKPAEKPASVHTTKRKRAAVPR